MAAVALAASRSFCAVSSCTLRLSTSPRSAPAAASASALALLAVSSAALSLDVSSAAAASFDFRSSNFLPQGACFAFEFGNFRHRGRNVRLAFVDLAPSVCLCRLQPIDFILRSLARGRSIVDRFAKRSNFPLKRRELRPRLLSCPASRRSRARRAQRWRPTSARSSATGHRRLVCRCCCPPMPSTFSFLFNCVRSRASVSSVTERDVQGPSPDWNTRR